jgi:hypothetical protein
MDFAREPRNLLFARVQKEVTRKIVTALRTKLYNLHPKFYKEIVKMFVLLDQRKFSKSRKKNVNAGNFAIFR